MLDIVICDDSATQAEYTARIVNRAIGDIAHDTEIFLSPQALLDKCSAGDYAPDIAVLDIAMGEMSGIELAKRLNALAPGCRIIFLTGYLNYATEVYSAEHCYFILKSELKFRIGDALEKALAAIDPAHSTTPSLIIKMRSKTIPVSISTVKYIERIKRQTRVATMEGEYITYQTPKELITGEVEKYFLRCHQSFWVQPNAVKSMDGNDFVMQSGERIPISRSLKLQVKEQFFSIISRPKI